MGAVAYENVLKRVLSEKRLLLTTHRTPDPDGLGAELAMRHLLLARGKDVIILNPEPAPKKIKFLDPENHAQDLRTIPDRSVAENRTIVILDNSDLGRIDDIQKWVRPDRSNLVIIDHHDGMRPEENVIFAFPQTGSSCEIVYELFEAAGVEINEMIANALYGGIIADTGNFRYRKTSSRTHQIAAHLMQFGINPADMAEKLFENQPMGRLILKKKLYSNLVVEQGRLAYFQISKTDLDSLGLGFDDLDGLVNELIESESIQSGILFTGRGPDVTKVSVRSRGSVDMLACVQKFGGGGHKNACGATIPMDLTAAIKQFVPEALKCLDAHS